MKRGLVVLALLSTGAASPPTVVLVTPRDGGAVGIGFAMTATCTPTDGSKVAELDFAIDGDAVGAATSPPYTVDAPTSYVRGTHIVAATCLTDTGATASADATVQLDPCAIDTDCADATDVCVDGTCVVGPTAPGGLGITCHGDDDCAAHQCVTDDSSNHCVVVCDETAAAACPAGFDCLDDAGTGICWPSSASPPAAGAGCSAGGGGPARLGSLLGGILVMLVIRRRRNRAC